MASRDERLHEARSLIDSYHNRGWKDTEIARAFGGRNSSVISQIEHGKHTSTGLKTYYPGENIVKALRDSLRQVDSRDLAPRRPNQTPLVNLPRRLNKAGQEVNVRRPTVKTPIGPPGAGGQRKELVSEHEKSLINLINQAPADARVFVTITANVTDKDGKKSTETLDVFSKGGIKASTLRALIEKHGSLKAALKEFWNNGRSGNYGLTVNSIEEMDIEVYS